MLETLLSVKGLNKWFKDKHALKDISFDVKRGEIMAILGPNGAGKSTTIRNIMEIIQPDSGEIEFTGHQGIPRDKIGYLPEERGLYKNVRVMDMLLFLADLKNYPLKQARERALAYLEKFGLGGKENMKLEEFSKGMSQKVQFIASILHEPELLILDEPFSGLDPVSQDQFKEEIYSLAQNGTAILVSSHQMNVIEQICSRLFMIQNGQKVIYGTLDDVKTQYANFKCTIRGENLEQAGLENLPLVVRTEYKEGMAILSLGTETEPAKWLRQLPETLEIHELSIDRISLHEIFIDIATERNLIREAGEVYA